MSKILVVGTLDSKGTEHKFVADKINQLGFDTILVDLGTYQQPTIQPDISRFEVTKGFDLKSVIDTKDRGKCVEAIIQYAPKYIANLVANDSSIKGIISLGGGGGNGYWNSCYASVANGFS